MNKTIKKIILGSLLFCGALGSAVGIYTYITHQQSQLTILDFQEDRDKPFILDIFKTNWYWLVSEYSKEFSPEYMLEKRASSKKPEHIGNLTIKVGYEGTEPVGFVAYYKKSFYEGFLLFLAVREQFRSKGYGYQLARYAIDDFKNRFVTKIKLVTRTTNYSAMKIYKKIGFEETSRDEDGFVYFQYDVA